MNCAVGNCSYETNDSFVEKVLATGPLSEIKQPKATKAKNRKSYRRNMVAVPDSSNHHNGYGDSCVGKGQENCLKNQWSSVRSHCHQIKEGAHREKKISVGKHHYCSDRVEVDYWKATDPGSPTLNWHFSLENSSANFCNQPAPSHGYQYLNADEHKGVLPRLSVPHHGGGMNRAAHSATYKSFHASMYSRSSMVFNYRCQAKPVKWVPVAAAKASEILPKFHRGTNFTSHSNEKSPSRTAKTNTKAKVDTVCKKPAVVESESSKPCDNNITRDEPKSESPKKGGVAYAESQKETDEFVGSRAVIESLTAAYKQQLLSEIIQFTVGYPLADFETFIKSSSPVMTSSVSSVCEREMQNVSLSGLWNWYEKPGSFGLKVRIEPCQDLNGFFDEKALFDAHFVPSLSAVQLFGYPVHLNSEAKSQESTSPKPAAKSDTCGQKVLFSNVFQCTNHGKVKLISSSPCSSNPELLFEFFESEQPYNRKPLHLKIMELTESGTSNSQVYGDPQKLVSLTLNELHPASWFSVAWYPIYRIPEGKLRSSFLTYHSLGHYVTKGGFPAYSSSNMTCHTLFPAVGLQSLNTQGECWFDLKRRFENSPKQSVVGDSEILKRRLQTLEGNASLLARGCVTKGNIKVTNRQSDYEFFVSRKR